MKQDEKPTQLNPYETLGTTFISERIGKKTTKVCPKHGNYETFPVYVKGIPILMPCPECEKEADIEKIKSVQVRKELTIEQRLMAASVPTRFMEACFEKWETDTPEMFSVRKTALRLANEITASSRPIGRSYIFVGPPGTGKTMLAVAIIRKVVASCRRAKYSSAGDLFASIKATFNGEGTELAVIDSFVRPDLLVLDEVGQSFGTDSERVLLFRVINGRYEKMRPTIMITNLPLRTLTSLGEPVLDRIKEGGGGILEFTGRSKRR